MRKGFTLVELMVILAILAILAVLLIPAIQQANLIANATPQEVKNVVCTKTFEYARYRENATLIAVFKDGGKLISLMCEPSTYAKINEDAKYNIKYKKSAYANADGYLVEVIPLD
jgi:prepilin-type N-terminal cleavage/methylation domain-containing protein